MFQLIVFLDADKDLARSQGWGWHELHPAMGHNFEAVGPELGLRIEVGYLPLSLTVEDHELFWSTAERAFGADMDWDGFRSAWILHCWDQVDELQLQRLKDRLIEIGFRLGWASVQVAVAGPLDDEKDAWIELADRALDWWHYELERWWTHHTGRTRETRDYE